MRAALVPGVVLTTLSNALAQVEVPLVLQEIAPGVERLALHLRIGDSAAHLVLLDTGSDPLIFGSEVQLPSSTVSLGQSSSISYGITASDTFDFDTFRDDISFSTAVGHKLVTVSGFGFAKATAGEPGKPFAGIMGAGPSIDPFDDSAGGSGFTLFSLLAAVDYPEGVLPGFTIAMNAERTRGTLTIGIHPAKLKNFAQKFPMTPKPPHQPDFQHFPSYDGDQLSLVVSVSGRSPSPVTLSGGAAMLVKIDSGDPGVTLVLEEADYSDLGADYLQSPSAPDSDLLPGTLVSLVGDAFAFDLSITTPGLSPWGGNAEIVDPPASYVHVNTGIQLYYAYAISYVFDDGEGNGWVGFDPLPGPDSRVVLHVKARQTAVGRSLRIRGTASVATTRVFYRAKGDRKWRAAHGTTSWSFRARGLEPGSNIFQVRAIGAGGQSQTQRVVVRRKKQP